MEVARQLCSGSSCFVAAPSLPQTALRGVSNVEAPAPSKASGLTSGMMALAAPAVVAGAVVSSQRRAKTGSRAQVVASKAYDASSQVGVTAPMGYFDPCNFMKDADEATFADYRAKELKHGRVAMLSIVGFLVQPFAESSHIGFSGVPGGVEALYTYPGSAGFGVLFLVAGFFELRILPDMEKSPGNFDDPLKISAGGNVGGYDDSWRNFELNNGRLAMIGSIGTIAAGFYTGYDAYGQWANAKSASIDFIKTTLQNAAP